MMPPNGHLDQEISLGLAARLWAKRSGRSVNLNTLVRWSMAGVRGVKLRTVRHDRRLFTTRRWLGEFIAALNAQPQVPAERRGGEQTAAQN